MSRSKLLKVGRSAVLGGAFGLGVLALQGPAFAQAVDGAKTYAIPAGPLANSLARFAREAGLTLSYTPDLVAGATAPPLDGVFTSEEALAQILSGTDLRYRFSNTGTVSLERLSQDDANGAPLARLAPITVEGELLDRTRQETRTSVAIVTGEELEQRSDPDIFTVIERTPGVTSAAGNQAFAIRGVPSFGFAAGRGNGQAIATVVDGTAFSNLSSVTSEVRLSTWDLEQIEVLRGPQSTQTGRNALFGVVNLQSLDPSYEQEFKLRGEVARFESLGGAFAANIPLIDDTLALRVSGDLRRSDGFIDNPTLGLDDTGESENATLRAAFRFDPTDSITATLRYTYIDDSVGQNEVSDALFSDQRTSLVDTPFSKDTELNSVNLDMEFFINDQLSLVSKTNFLDGDSISLDDADGTAFPGGVVERTRDGSNIQQELQLRYQSDDIEAALGGFFADIKEENLTLSIGPVSSRLAGDLDTRNFAVFGEVEAKVFEDFSVIAGFRYDRETAENRTENTLGGFTLGFEAEDTYGAFLPKLGLVYSLAEDLSIGFTAQRGYRAGGIASTFAGEPDPFDPEFTWNFEGSVRSQWLDGRVTANANVFYTQWRDQQVIQTVPAGPPFFVDVDVLNAGQSRLFGGEIDLSVLPTERLEVFMNGAFVDTEFTEFVALGQDFSGNEFNYAPKFTAAAGATYTFEEGFFLSGDLSYTSDSFADPANTLQNDARFLVNARAGYRAEHWQVFAFARNLFDNAYALERLQGTDGLLVEPGEPLTFGLVGQVRF
ncbi:MAG: TonB-dependent receptor [Pseudomonadota bacterium]